MKCRIFTPTLLGLVGVVSAADHASMNVDTWCITYLSTYLAPVSNQVSLPSTRRESPSEESGRLPVTVVPSSRPTFGRNSSIPVTRPALSTDLEGASASDTSLIVSESIDTSRSAPVGSGSSSLDIETTTGALTNELITSSVQTTGLDSTVSGDAIPTSSGLIEPAGRSVIFLISTPDNEKRDIYKRASGGFVGNNNPKVCTFAATFNLAQGQLFEGGVPIYYSGEDNKELAGQDRPGSDSITRTFSVSGQELAFRNSGLPSGEAGFCQTPDGKVYITFTTPPPGCITVSLGVYDVEQCQNGRLIGVDDLTSTGTTGQMTTSSVTSIETSGLSSGASDSEVSTNAAESTGITTTPPRASSSSVAGVESTGVSSQASNSETSINVAESTDITTSSPGASSSSTEEASGDSASLESTSNDSTTTSALDTASETTADTATSSDILTTDATTTTDTATGSDTTSSEVTTTSSAAPEPTDCSDLSNPYKASNGAVFDISCDTSPGGWFQTDEIQADLADCMQACSQDSRCVGVVLFKLDNSCSLFSGTVGGIFASDLYDLALRREADTTTDLSTTTSDAPTTTGDAPTTTSDAPTTTSSAPQAVTCSDTPDPYTAPNGASFDVQCNTDFNGYQPIDGYNVLDLIECMKICSENNDCVGVEFFESNSFCELVSQIIDGTYQTAGIAIGIRIDAPDTTTSADTTTPDIPTDTTTHLPTSTSAGPEPGSCHALSNPFTVNDVTFDLYCDTAPSNIAPYINVLADNFEDCVSYCVVGGSCNGVSFEEATNSCVLFSSGSDGNMVAGFDVALRTEVGP